MNSVFFGVANGVVAEGSYNTSGYDVGSNPSCAINGANQFVEVHESEGLDNNLYCWSGSVVGTELVLPNHGPICLSGGTSPDTGSNPSVAINSSGTVVEAHDSGVGNELYWWLGSVGSGTDVSWLGHGGIAFAGDSPDNGCDAAIAIESSGLVVEVHNSGPLENTLWWWLGQVQDNSIVWKGHGPVNYSGNSSADGGCQPSVAVNSSGQVVEVHSSGDGDLWYWVGQIEGDAIYWVGHAQYDSGVTPSVALGDDGSVIEVHQSELYGTLYQRIGKLTGDSIVWMDPFNASPACYSYPYDSGATPSVTFNGSVAVQVHASPDASSGLYATACYWFDRANWMSDNVAVIGCTPLSRLVLPATHDSSMYVDMSGGFLDPAHWSILGKTQAFDYMSQLSYGIRYFDIRPKWDGSQFLASHGVIDGPPLSDILSDVSEFYTSGAKEPAIFKFSHYADFSGPEMFSALCSQIYAAIGKWMYSGSVAAGARLADTPLETLLSSATPILVVCDQCLQPSSTAPEGAWLLPQNEGFWVYRDWYALDPENGDLTVFDIYSDVDPATDDSAVADMMSSTTPDPNITGVLQGQYPKFSNYTGKCQQVVDGQSVPCDLFLLSWTLTPPTAVYLYSREANKCLGYYLQSLPTNAESLKANLLYVDYAGDARVTDVAWYRNGLASPMRTEQPVSARAASLAGIGR